MKYIIELEQIEGTELYKAKGCNTLVFDQNGIDKILKPLEEETEECPFENDELVEVSDDGISWRLRHFSRMKEGRYYTYGYGYNSSETKEVIDWDYCRKYGTLGELVQKRVL